MTPEGTWCKNRKRWDLSWSTCHVKGRHLASEDDPVAIKMDESALPAAGRHDASESVERLEDEIREVPDS